ncbi:MAG TPA: UDP-glucose 4-epimerase GalE [Candidatus Saccharimonadales bacterium]|nr:UDP-glucose 4-epimerase GalE [Candidatus Saccharimonadales bacterium]
MNILVTGGAGYIGSHTIIELIKDGNGVVVIDNLVNSSKTALERLEKITGVAVPFYEVDCADKSALSKVFDEHHIDAVIHFAGLKAVGESVSQPLRYYRNNLDSTLSLCEVMQEKGVKKLVFSSSATIYGIPQELPLHETSPRGEVTNPYGQTKLMIEQILLDLAVTDPSWDITLLRYFNPIGAHENGLIGEDPNGTPNNLLPYVAMVAVGKLPKVRVFGDDYDTPDGTGVRDYIHVVDLARGHVAALKHTATDGKVTIYNLGTGKGTSVYELIHAFEKACGKTIPYEVVDRRPGDVGSCYADVSKAERELHWKAEKTIEDGCADSWRWQSQNPNGYKN